MDATASPARGGVSMPIKRVTTVDVTPTPKELAECFCHFGADQQALFFHYIAYLSAEWDGGLPSQLQAVTDSPKMSPSARAVMRLIGEYGAEASEGE
jgi:hypothetical protein